MACFIEKLEGNMGRNGAGSLIRLILPSGFTADVGIERTLSLIMGSLVKVVLTRRDYQLDGIENRRFSCAIFTRKEAGI